MPLTITAALVVTLSTLTAEPQAAPAGQKDAADQQQPALGLKVGEKVPPVTLAKPNGDPVELETIYGKTPLVLVFYRGGWCPYCVKHIRDWQAAMPKAGLLGAYVIGVTTDRPGHEETLFDSDRRRTKFQILHDFDGSASEAFGLRFELPLDLRDMYKEFGVDLEKRNWDGTWNLPHPATFVIDTNGIIRYASVNEDYKERADPQEAIAVLQQMKDAASAK